MTTRPADCAGQPLDLEREMEKTPETQWAVEKIADLDGQGKQTTDLQPPPKKKILVIDDDPALRMLLKMGIGPHGYDCVTAENGKAAQPVFQTSRPDLILVDLLMPVMDGLAFIRWLRQTAQDSTPVLVFTNVDNPKITQEALDSGANFFVQTCTLESAPERDQKANRGLACGLVDSFGMSDPRPDPEMAYQKTQRRVSGHAAAATGRR